MNYNSQYKTKASYIKIILLLGLLFCYVPIIKSQETSSPSGNLDFKILEELNINRNKSWDASSQFVSNTTSVVAYGVPIVLFAVSFIDDDKPTRTKAIYIGESLAVSAVITTLSKYVVQRPRPFVTYPEIDKQSSGGSYSFPSGHTSSAFATATALSVAYPKWYIIAPSMFWASYVGYTRMSLGVHYPTDVLAGAIVGAGSAFITFKLNKYINANKTRKGKPVSQERLEFYHNTK